MKSCVCTIAVWNANWGKHWRAVHRVMWASPPPRSQSAHFDLKGEEEEARCCFLPPPTCFVWYSVFIASLSSLLTTWCDCARVFFQGTMSLHVHGLLPAFSWCWIWTLPPLEGELPLRGINPPESLPEVRIADFVQQQRSPEAPWRC